MSQNWTQEKSWCAYCRKDHGLFCEQVCVENGHLFMGGSDCIVCGAKECPATTVVALPYNAKGRPMHLGTCPTCGKEFRRTGRGTQVSIPAHAPEKKV